MKAYDVDVYYSFFSKEKSVISKIVVNVHENS